MKKSEFLVDAAVFLVEDLLTDESKSLIDKLLFKYRGVALVESSFPKKGSFNVRCDLLYIYEVLNLLITGSYYTGSYFFASSYYLSAGSSSFCL